MPRSLLFYAVLLFIFKLNAQIKSQVKNINEPFVEMDRTEINEKNEASKTIKQIGKLKRGKKYGVWQIFYEDAHLKSIGKYENGEKIGQWKTFYDGGGIKNVGEYINGKKEGIWKSYFANKQLKSIGKYKNGFKDGVWKTYFVNGKIARIQVFENFAIKKDVKYVGPYGVHYVSYVDYHKYEGDKHIILRSFDEEKNISEIKVFLNGKLILKKEYYYKTKQLSSVTEYVDEKMSHLKKYWKNGNLKEIAKFDSGRLMFSSYYYQNGQLKESVEWKYGRLFNIKDSFDPNGKKLKIGNLKNGNGIHLSYDSKGKLEYEAEYKDGKMINLERVN